MSDVQNEALSTGLIDYIEICSCKNTQLVYSHIDLLDKKNELLADTRKLFDYIFVFGNSNFRGKFYLHKESPGLF